MTRLEWRVNASRRAATVRSRSVTRTSREAVKTEWHRSARHDARTTRVSAVDHEESVAILRSGGFYEAMGWSSQ
jgi:hypothetical protein